MSSEQPDSTPWIEYPIGGYTEEEYSRLPMEYRDQVEGLERNSADRARRRELGVRISEDEMDKSGIAENALRFPPVIRAMITHVAESIGGVVKGELLLLHHELLPSVREHFYLLALQELAKTDSKLAEFVETKKDAGDLFPLDASPLALAEARLQQMGLFDILHDNERLTAEFLRLVEAAKGNVCLAAEELVTNSIKHGNLGDLRKNATARRRVLREVGRVDLQFRDEGHGFVREELPDPWVMLSSEHGRGLLLADSFTSPVELTEGGRVATVHSFLRDRMRSLINRASAEEIIKHDQEVRKSETLRQVVTA